MMTFSLKKLFLSFCIISSCFQLSANWQELIKEGASLTAQGAQEAVHTAGNTIAESASQCYQTIATALSNSKDRVARQTLLLAEKLATQVRNLKDTRAAQIAVQALTRTAAFAKKHPIISFATIYGTLLVATCAAAKWQNHKESKKRELANIAAAIAWDVQDASNNLDSLHQWRSIGDEQTAAKYVTNIELSLANLSYYEETVKNPTLKSLVEEFINEFNFQCRQVMNCPTNFCLYYLNDYISQIWQIAYDNGYKTPTMWYEIPDYMNLPQGVYLK